MRNRTVFRLGARVEVAPDVASSRATEDLWRNSARRGRPRPRPCSRGSTAAGDPGAYRYLLAVGCRGEARPGGRLALLVTLDFTRLVENHARRLPRNLLFVRDEAGVCLYHPDPKQVGLPAIPWDLAADGGPFGSLRDVPTDGLAYWTVRAGRSSRPGRTTRPTACGSSATCPAGPSCGSPTIREGDTSVVLSCADEKVLDEASKALGVDDPAASRSKLILLLAVHRPPAAPLAARRRADAAGRPASRSTSTSSSAPPSRS